MKTNILDRKIPTLLSVLIIGIGIIATTLLVKMGGFFPISATPSEEPKDVRITNVTDSSFTVSYSTDANTSGLINWGTTASLGNSFLDDRDQEYGKVGNYTIHNFTLRNLKPVTKYFFTIVSGKTNYSNNSSPFEITTGPILNTNPPDQDPLAGKVIMPDGNPPNEAIVYLVADNSQVISTITKPDGSYVLPLNSLRVTDLTSYYKLNLDTPIKILAVGEGLSSNASLQLLQSRPVPTITLSNNYDFTFNSAPSSSSDQLGGFPPLRKETKEKSPTIETPAKDQSFDAQNLQFKGTALANENVQIIINSDEEIKATIKADSNGNWSYKPESKLDPGTHTITIISRDSSGILKTIKQTFIITADAASNSPTPTVVPPQTTTPTPTTIPTSVLETVVSPTPIDLTINQTQISTLPKTGSADIMFSAIIGFTISILGVVVFLFARKKYI